MAKKKVKVKPKKSPSKKKDPSDVSKADWREVMKEAGIPAKDKRYISDPNDPRAKEICKTNAFKELMKNIRKRTARIHAGRSPEQTSEIVEEGKKQVRDVLSEKQIKSIFDQRWTETGKTEVKSKEERDAEAVGHLKHIESVQEYLQKPRTKKAPVKKKAPKKRIKRKTTTEAIPILDDDKLLNRLKQVETTLKKERDEKKALLIKIKNTVGPEKARYFSDLDKSLTQLFKILDKTSEKKNKFKKIVESLRGIAEKGVKSYFKAFGTYMDESGDRDDFFDMFGGRNIENILTNAGEDNVEITSKPGKPLMAKIASNEILLDILSKIIKSYDLELEQVFGYLSLSRSEINALTEELQKYVDPALIYKLSGDAKGREVTVELENKKRIDEFPQLKRDLARLRNELKELKGKRSQKQDVKRIFEELIGISKALEAAGKPIVYEQDPTVSSSKVLDLPKELNKIRKALTGRVINIAGREDEISDLNEKIEDLESKLAKRPQARIKVDPIHRRLKTKFLTANNILEAYASEVGFSVTELPVVFFNDEGAIFKLIANYLSVLKDIKELVKKDIVPAEEKVEKEFKYLVKKLPAKLKKNKNIMQIRKGIEHLIKQEEEKTENTEETIPAIIKSRGILKTNIKIKTGHEEYNVNSLAAYVDPLYERVEELDELSERQQEFAEDCGYEDGFEVLKETINALQEDVENQVKGFYNYARTIAYNLRQETVRKTATNLKVKPVITKPDAEKLIKNVHAKVKELDKNEKQIKKEKAEILDECIVPRIKTYDQFKAWLYETQDILEAAGNPIEYRNKMIKLVQKIDPEQEDTLEASKKYLNNFVNTPTFTQINNRLSYFTEISDEINAKFCSGHELVKVIDKEMSKVNQYLRAEKTRLRLAEKILANGK